VILFELHGGRSSGRKDLVVYERQEPRGERNMEDRYKIAYHMFPPSKGGCHTCIYQCWMGGYRIANNFVPSLTGKEEEKPKI